MHVLVCTSDRVQERTLKYRSPIRTNNRIGHVYLGPVSTMVKKYAGCQEFQPKKRLVETMVGMADKMEVFLFYKEPQVRILQRLSFLFKGLRWPKKLDIQSTPLTKSVTVLTTTSFFHSCSKLCTEKVIVIM